VLTATQAGFATADGQIRRFIELAATEPEQAWVERQNASVGEYLDHTEEVPAEIETLYDLFDCFVSACLTNRRGQKLLDVGCGIRSDWPHYVHSLRKGMPMTGHVYVGLDPMSHNLDKREYPFVAGRLEDLPGTFIDPFDVFLFSTSLDHFQDLSLTAQTVRSLASPGALAIFWVGLHDQTLVGEHLGAQIMHKLYRSLHPLRFIPRLLETLVKLLANYLRLLRRRRDMYSGVPLDKLHFHYFTQKRLAETLPLFGTMERYVHVPGTNSVFVCVQMP
jgi:hypothetical protein